MLVCCQIGQLRPLPLLPTSSSRLLLHPNLKSPPHLAPPKRRHRSPCCLFGGGAKGADTPGKDNDDSPWKSLEKAMGNLKKERSIQDILREQMEEQELGGGGDSGNVRGGGGGGDGGDGSGDSDEGLKGILDELVEVILATLGIIFVYYYLINGEELSRLAKDYVFYLFGANPSVRLRRAMAYWRRTFQTLKRMVRLRKARREVTLDKALIYTPTLYYRPKKKPRKVRRKPSRPSRVEEEEDEFSTELDY